MGWVKTRIVSVVTAGMLVLCGASLAADFGGHEIVSQSEDKIVFTVRLPHYRLDTLFYEGREYVRPYVVGMAPFAEEGKPDLPVFSVLLAVPPGAEARLVSVSVAGESRIDDVRVAPVPGIEARGEGKDQFPFYIYAEDTGTYGNASLFPEIAVWLTDRGTLRHQDVVRVVIAPFRYAPLESRVSVTEEITVTVAFEGGDLLRGGLAPEDAWEGVYRGALLNYQQGRQWRKAPARMLKGGAVTNDRVKILIDTTGIYRIGYDMLAAIGFPGNIPVGELFVYRDAFRDGTPDTVEMVESAIEVADNDEDGVLSPGDTVSFFALDFYDQFGRRGGEDYFFDKNVYWFSWSAGQHMRIQSRSGWRDGVSPQVPSSFTDFVHEEEDLNFVNFPPTGEEIDFFTWQRWRSDFDFTLPGVDSLLPATLMAKFVNYYSVPEKKNTSGSVSIYITSCNTPQTRISTLSLALPLSTTRSIPIDADILCSKGNTFRFESGLPSSWTPGHQLDWFEVVYARKYEALEDILAFDNGGLVGEVEYRIQGFSGADIAVYDVTDSIGPVRIELGPEQIVEDSGTFTLTLRDSIAGTRKYFSFCSSCVREPAPETLSLRDPPVLRELAAEYLIVTHPDFAEGLDPLIARREAQGHSVLLATIDEVYNDFGNGAKSDVAIKRFAKNGFHNGNAQFLLLVGDANVDRRGVLLDPPGSQLASDVDYVPSRNKIFKDGSSVNKEIRPIDNWFAMLDGFGDMYPDIYIGRFPVDDTEELDAMITKVETFEDYTGTDPWKKELLFIADDYYRVPTSETMRDSLCVLSGEPSFERACDSVSVIAKDFAVVGVDTVKYYLRWCTNNHEPERRAQNLCVGLSSAQVYTRANCTPDLIPILNSGALLVNFQGHSNHWQFTYETLVRDDFYYNDVENLSNAESPFMFLGFGCWISDFQRQSEAASFIGEAIAEKFVKNAGGGACLSFSSACAEYITSNERFNPFVIRAIFTHLRGYDPQGNPVPARILAGEAMVTSLLRFGNSAYAEQHIFLGDPAMVVDMGPPMVSLTADGTPVNGSYVYTGADTLTIIAEIKDEEAIMSIDLDIIKDDEAIPVSPDAYTAKALVDTGFPRSRAYEVVYDHVPLFGDYTIEVSGEDYVGKSSMAEIRVQTGSASFFRDEKELEEGDHLVFGQELRIEINRPEAVAQDHIEVTVDSIPASEFDAYSIEMLDAEGKEWEVSFIPSLDQGEHTVTVKVLALTLSRAFEYVPGRIEVFADDKVIYDNDYVSPRSEFEVVIETVTAVDVNDLGMGLDGEGVPVAFVADSTGTVFTASFAADLETGEHELTVQILEVSVSRVFRVSKDLALRDVSAFPSPFSDETYFFYTLSQDAREVSLFIYTVSGRLIFEGDMPATAGYNQYLWDGRDMTFDRIANGTYFYRIVAKTRSRERESTGWVVKIE